MTSTPGNSSYPPLRQAEKYFKSRTPRLSFAVAPAKAIKLQKRCRSALEAAADGPFEARRILQSQGLPLEALGYPLLRGSGVLDLSRPGLDLEGQPQEPLQLNVGKWDKERDEVWRAGWEQDDDPLGGQSLSSEAATDLPWMSVRKRPCVHAAAELRRFDEPAGWIRDKTSHGPTGEQADLGEWIEKRGVVIAPGCLLLPQYYTPNEQLSLLHACMREYPRPPNPTNLEPDKHLRPSAREVDEVGPWERCFREATRQRVLRSSGPQATRADRRDSLVRSLRWTNLGWVYDWTLKAYEFDLEPANETSSSSSSTADNRSSPIPFPPTLARELRDIVAGIPWRDVFSEAAADTGASATGDDPSRWPSTYAPSSGIVNYYPLSSFTTDAAVTSTPASSMTSHVDRAERPSSRTRPLVSLSLGSAAIFLLGGTSRDDTHVRRVLLRSGDVLVMSGQQGRARYHGVPRVLEGTTPMHLRLATKGDGDEAHSGIDDGSLGDDANDAAFTNECLRYISHARINVNARQVF